MIVNSQRTAYALNLEMNMRFGKTHIPLQNTTLNEKFEVFPTYEEDVSDIYPTLQYYAIGVGGLDVTDEASGYSYSSHSPVDAALFEHTPFIMRRVGHDIDAGTRSNYRLRTIENIKGVDYICYYLKKIPGFELRDQMFKLTIDSDIGKLNLFDTNTDKLLNPEPRVRNVENISYKDAEYIAKVSKLEFYLSNWELEEIQHSIETMYGVNRKLTEIGICSGKDINTNTFQESIDVEIMYHAGVDIDTAMYISNNDTVLRSIEIGGMEPLLR